GLALRTWWSRCCKLAMSRLCVALRYVKPIVEQRQPIVLNQIVVAPELCEIVAAFVCASDEELAMHLVYVEAIGTDCQPIVNVGIRASTAFAPTLASMSWAPPREPAVPSLAHA